jgi:uncharacterized membrane protein
MEQKCCITGVLIEETEGLSWSQLRPSVQEFLKNTKGEWNENSFVSFVALQELMRNYITNKAAEEDRLHRKMERKIEKEFTEEKAMEEINSGIEEKPPTYGERWADRIAEFGGSWKFILIFLSVMVVWMILNAAFLRESAFDPYPFILLNLALSCLAALQAPIIMMSQNRQEDKDRAHAEYDFRVNVKAETEIRSLHEKLDHLLQYQHRNIDELFHLQLDMMQMMQQRIDALTVSQQANQQNENNGRTN